MFRTALKGVAGHRLRFLLTAVAIVVGVAFVSGSFVFTDTINSRFENLFSDIYSGVDVSVRPTEGDSVDASILEEVIQVTGVEQAAGTVEGLAQLIADNGEPIGGQGPPTIGSSWNEVAALNPLEIVDGRAPTAPGEVVIDAPTAEAQGWTVGERIGVQTAAGVDRYQLVGLADFAGEGGLGGLTLAVFELSQAQQLFGLEGRFSAIEVVGSSEQQVLAEAIAASLPAGLEAVTGAQQSGEQLDEITEGLSFLTTGLLAFAGVAVLVGAFIIQNTFRIIVGQRTRELALLRAVGATGRQVTTMVALEALIVSVLASAAGVVAGIGLAVGIKAALGVLGIDLPEGPITLLPRTVAVGMAVGVVVTMVSALLPARKAAKVPPVAAMRAEAIEAPTVRSLRMRALVGGAGLVLGSALIGLALFGDLPSPAAWVGAGALTAFLSVSALSPLFARPAASTLGAPFRGITGKLARENTSRNPRRSAATASALMIGVALVAFVSVFAASIKASVADSIESAFPADLSIESSNFGFGLSAAALDGVAGLDQVGVLSPVTFGADWVAVDPDTIGAVFDGGDGWDPALLEGGVLMAEGTAEGLTIGDPVTIDGDFGSIDIPFAGTISNPGLGNVMISIDAADRMPEASLAFVALADGVSVEQGQAAVEIALDPFPNLEVSTASDVVADAERQVDQLVGLFTGLLGLAIVIAVMGIANTLMLSIVERTREIGLLRAVGMSRRQIGSMIRSEAVIIAVFGAVLGVVLGTGLGTAVARSLADEGLGSIGIPYEQLGLWLAAAAVAGVIAAIWPGRKAGRLDVLGAISYE